uniref:Uncharacterized protein n=1 Tax=Physcomitrium patens TaxID=3218 RepID=A0A2K1KVE5_PHYPA|nr:hypothetical protein PHYPA_004756 [Physcomitrium patens]
MHCTIFFYAMEIRLSSVSKFNTKQNQLTKPELRRREGHRLPSHKLGNNAIVGGGLYLLAVIHWKQSIEIMPKKFSGS